MSRALPFLLPPLAAAGACVLSPAAAMAQPTPVPMCLEQREGMTFCFETKLCLCRYEAGGTLTGRPAGYRWDCGALRPACGVVPPDTNPAPQPPMTVMPFVQPGWPGQPPAMR